MLVVCHYGGCALQDMCHWALGYSGTMGDARAKVSGGWEEWIRLEVHTYRRGQDYYIVLCINLAKYLIVAQRQMFRNVHRKGHGLIPICHCSLFAWRTYFSKEMDGSSLQL